MSVETARLQPHKQSENREDKVEVAVVRNIEVDCTVVAVENPAGDKTGHNCDYDKTTV